jgi:hypothetical protein
MKDRLRLVVALTLSMGLAGCNMVVSEEPWFTAADAAPEPVLRDGLWLQAAADCRVDEAEPAERWPECAHATFVRGSERWTMRWDQESGRRRRSFAGWESDNAELSDALLIQNGDHLIAQDPPPAEAVGERAEEGDREVYTYAALRPLRHDDQGKVTAMAFWLVQCGPLPEQKHERRGRSRRDDDAAADAGYVTDRPFPGLTVVENDCVATSVGALRNAAVLSESLGPPFEMRWLREGWR